MNDQLLKGPAAEEALRNYFLSIGYYVIRGCKFKYNKFDVTDVDLWLYGRSSAFSRERLNVDIKNKKTPQALERIFWTKGVQAVLGLDGCIVATNDSRPDVRQFGIQHQVKVLDGRFMGLLTKSSKTQLERITEEQFFKEVEAASLGKVAGDWRGRYEASKARLLSSLTFDGCNAWLHDIQFFLTHFQSSSPEVSPVLRMIYAISSHFAVAVDFIMREHVAAEAEERRLLLDGGFRYGAAGKAFTEKVGRMAAALVGSLTSQLSFAETVEHELMQQAAGVKAELLADFFSKTTTQTGLFETSRELEAAAFAINTPLPSLLSGTAKSLIGVLCDFYSIDRKRIII